METRRKREVAWRVFASELNSAVHTQMGSEAYEPNYIITEAGAKINRVFITGVFTEKDNVGSEDDPLWRARVIDPTGAFFISAGRFQPEAAKIFGELEPPLTLALVGKIRTFTSDDGRMFVSVRPEVVKSIKIPERNQWILETCKLLLRRLECLNEALNMEPLNEANLLALGYNKLEVDGVTSAIKVYDYKQIDLTRYEQQVRELLVNLKDGIYDIDTLPSDIFAESSEKQNGFESEISSDSQAADIEAKENIIRNLVEELDKDSKIGVVYQKVLELAESKGLTRDDTEECVNILMNKGVIFEPALGYLKSIEK